MTVFIGCYSDAAHPDALKTVRLDPASGRMELLRGYRVSNALYQALSPDGTVLYSCTGEGLASFRLADGDLTPVDAVALGKSVCHVAVLDGGARVTWAEYLGGEAGTVAVDGGRFGAVTRYRHEGSGPNLPRQASAHCHQALPMPDGARYCVVDLGLDRVVTYPEGRVFPTVPAGAGPRHLLFHPGGRLAFLVSELGNLLSTLRVGEDGDFAYLDTQPTLPAGETGRGPNGDLAAAVRLTPDGRRVVVSNRGEESLVTYDVDAETGRLTLAARTRLPGSWPRDFIFTAPDRALVAMERSGELHALAYDAATGGFTVLATLGGLHRPVACTVAPGLLTRKQ